MNEAGKSDANKPEASEKSLRSNGVKQILKRKSKLRPKARDLCSRSLVEKLRLNVCDVSSQSSIAECDEIESSINIPAEPPEQAIEDLYRQSDILRENRLEESEARDDCEVSLEGQDDYQGMQALEPSDDEDYQKILEAMTSDWDSEEDTDMTIRRNNL